MWRVDFITHSGMRIPIYSPDDDATEARRAFAGYARRLRRQACDVVYAERRMDGGACLEFQSVGNQEGTSISDDDGYLLLRHVTYPCQECGSECETKEQAAGCCYVDDWAERPEEDD